MPALPSAGHVASINSGPVDGDVDPSTKALYELEHTVNSNARKYNDLKLVAEKKTEQLRQLSVRACSLFSACTWVVPPYVVVGFAVLPGHIEGVGS